MYSSLVAQNVCQLYGHKTDCLLCDKIIKANWVFTFRVKTPRAYSTKSLKNNLRNKHPSTFRILKCKKNETSRMKRKMLTSRNHKQ